MSTFNKPYFSSMEPPPSIVFARRRGLDPVDAYHVCEEQLTPLFRRHTVNHALDGFPGARIEGSDVGKIRLPHDVVDADMVAQLNAFGFEPEVHIHLAAQGLARARGDAFGPQMPALPLMVAGG